MSFNLHLHQFLYSDFCYLGTSAQKERELAHQAELKKEQEEVSRLKAELEKSRGRTAELEKSTAEEKQLRTEETRKLKESLGESESRITSAENELQSLKTKITRWVGEFASINGQLDSKFLLFLSLPDIPFFLPCDSHLC